jgi:hypothetical protein
VLEEQVEVVVAEPEAVAERVNMTIPQVIMESLAVMEVLVLLAP